MQLVSQRNPFDPGDRSIVALSEPRTLAELAPITTQPFILLHNGDAVLRADWPMTRVQDGDIATVVYLPAGGGGGKDPMRIVLSIAVVVLSAYTGGAAAGLFGGVGTATGAAVGAGVSAATALGGMALINAVLPTPRLPSSQATAQAAESSPTYSLSGQGNRARLGSAIPEQFGRVKCFPDLAAQPYTEYVGYGDQYLYELFLIGRGGYQINNIYIGDSLIGSYSDVEYQIVPPGGSQTLFPTSVITSDDVSDVLVTDAYTTAFAVNPAGTSSGVFSYDIVFPQGIYLVDDYGKFQAVHYRLVVEYRAINDSGVALEGWQVGDTVDETGSVIGQALRKTRWVNVGDRTRVEVRMIRSGDDYGASGNYVQELYWTALKAHIVDMPDYGDSTLLAIRLRATGQLSGAASRQVSVDCTRKLPAYSGGWSEAVTTKAAWALAYVLRGENGVGLEDTRVDIPGLEALASAGWDFNGRFDAQITAWEALSQIARTARARPYIQGGVVRFARDIDQTVPVAMFSDRNMLRGSFSLDYIPPSENTALAVGVRYMDADVWRERRVAARWDGTEISPDDAVVEVDLFGVTSRDVAFADAFYQARSNKYRRRIVRFATEMDGFIPSPGDLISITHEMPSWGVAGDVVEWVSGTRTAKLSEAPKWADGAQTIVLRKRDGTMAGPYAITQGSDAYHAVLASTPSITPDTGGNRERTHFAAGLSNAYNRLAIVTAIRPRSADSVEIEAVVDDQRVRSAPGTSPPVEVIPPIYDACLAPEISGLTLNTGETVASVSASWSAPVCAKRFDVEISGDAGTTWERIANEIDARLLRIANPHGMSLTVRVRAYGDTVGPWSAAVGLSSSTVGTASGLLAPPTNITAEAHIGGAWMSYTPNPSQFLASTFFYTNTADDFATAELTGTAPAYADMLLLQGMTGNVLHYVWATSVNADQREGAAAGPVTVTPILSPSLAIEDLEGILDESYLTTELNARIDLIDTDGDGLVDTVAGLGSDLAAEVATRLDQITAIQAELDTIASAADFSTDNLYSVDDIVVYSGGLYRCILDITSIPAPLPTNVTYWEKIGDYQSINEAIAAYSVILSDHETRVTSNEGEISSFSTEITTLQSDITDAETGISSNSTAIGALDSRVTSAEGDIDAHSSAITSLITTVAGKASSSALTALTSRVTTNEGAINTQAFVITSLITTVEGKAASSYVDAVEARVDTAEGNINSLVTTQTSLVATAGGGSNLIPDSTFQFDWSQNGSVYTNSNFEPYYPEEPSVFVFDSVGGERAFGIKSNGGMPISTGSHGQITIPDIPVNANERIQASVYSGATRSEAKLIVTFWTSAGSYISETSTSSSNTKNNYETDSKQGGSNLSGYKRLFVFATVPATASSLRVVLRCSGNGTNYGSNEGYAHFVRPYLGTAGDSQTVPSPWSPGVAGSTTAALKSEGMVFASEANGGTSGATYSLKLQANDGSGSADAGMGLAVIKENGHWISDVRFRTNRFAIIDATDDPDSTPTSAKYPFIVSGGTVYIKNASIQNAAIEEAKIASAAVTEAKIASAAVTEAKIGSLAVTNAKIADAAIGTAKIATLAVGTLKIAGEAVVVPRATYTAGASGGLTTSWNTIDSISLTTSASGRLLVTYTAMLRANPGTYGIGFDVRLLYNGTQYYYREHRVPVMTGFAYTYAPFSISYASAGANGSGSYTIVVQVRMKSSEYSGVPALENRSLVVFGVMR